MRSLYGDYVAWRERRASAPPSCSPSAEIPVSRRGLTDAEADRWLRFMYELGYQPSAGQELEAIDALAEVVEPHMVAITDAIREFRKRRPSG